MNRRLIIKLHVGEIPDEVMEYVIESLQNINFGEVVLIAQDGFLMQVERLQKLRISHWDIVNKSMIWTEIQRSNIESRIRKEFEHLRFGRLVIKVQQGNIVQFERTEMQRFTGLDGEGI